VDSLVGQRLGAYFLESEIGRGSMGVVYRAHHAEQGFPAAVKVLLDALASDQSFVTRFTREARIVRTLQHPNILRLYDAGHDGGHIYFAMEFFAGSTAGQLLKQRGKLPVGQVVEIAAQAADALDYAHTHGHLVHRDIKPENLLVDRWCRVKVLDFGLARVEGLHSITRAGTVVGSLYYVSPEQLLGQQLDGRSDVYALGVSMYEMLTGQRPYRGRTLSEMSDVILAGRAVPPSQLEPSVPLALEAIIQRAIARDLQWRFSSAGELHAELRALQAPPSSKAAYHTSGPRAVAPGPPAYEGAEAPPAPWRLGS
jgi:serine/threonine-protein kinase